MRKEFKNKKVKCYIDEEFKFEYIFNDFLKILSNIENTYLSADNPIRIYLIQKGVLLQERSIRKEENVTDKFDEFYEAVKNL